MTKLKLLTAPDSLRLQLPAYQRVYLTLVGCGGTGSHIASGLVAIAQALTERNVSMEMLLIDPDSVEPKNIGRQLFSLADLGRPKAEVLAERLNTAFGLTIGAAVRFIDTLDTFTVPDALNIIVGAVDNPAARAIITRAVKEANGQLWWLDCGNENHSGQIAVGNCADAKDLAGAVALGMLDRLPAPSVIYPDLVKQIRFDKPKKRVKRGPSCAELAVTGEQGLMVNRMCASWACSMLHDFLLGELRYFSLAFDLGWGGTQANTIDLPTLAKVSGLSEKALKPAKEKAKK